MKNISSRVKHVWLHVQRFAVHELHQHPVFKFLIVFTLLIAYTLFTSHKFGAREGIGVSMLTWSFFVLCTPIADAGFLLDLPLRLITRIRMVWSEVGVWIIAILLNVWATVFVPEVYEDTVLLSLFAHIIHQPFPYWGIIILSAIGTFLSIIFGDEILDIAYKKKDVRHHHSLHRRKHHFLVILFLILLTLILYDFLLTRLGVHISLF
ncbi:hypothetical protein GOV11_00075 [Candidatus Woesearchaeota archaeon]|nr:hypothetical protein [Candidatus Woesearchaeota archaeon]